MKFNFSIKKLTRIGLFIMVKFFFILPLSAIAQSKDTVISTTKTKKTARIFYGLASFYANKFNGRRTANGEVFNQKKMSLEIF